MRGFTLIELLVTLAIVAVLAAITLPGYRGVVHKAQRTEARLALLWIQFQQERHYAAHNIYAAALTDLAGRSNSDDYDLAVTLTNEGQGYVATAEATATGRQANDRPCHWFSIDESGQRSSATAAGVWTVDDANRCWS
jgi:type IV pilus assembly protein PilE